MARTDAEPSSPRPRTQPEINAFRRRALIRGAIRSVAELGVAGTTVETIAGFAGGSRGLMGHYYAGKGELLLAAYEALCEGIAEEIGRAARESGSDARSRLHAMARSVFSPPVFDPVNLAAFLAFWHEARTDAPIRQANQKLYAEYRRTVARLFRRAAREEGKPTDAARAAIGLIGLIDGLWIELTLDPAAFPRRTAIEICVRYVDDQLGLGHRTKGGRHGTPRSA